MHVCAHTRRPKVNLSCSSVHLIFETESLTGTWDPLIRVGTSHQALGLCWSVSSDQGFLVLGTIIAFFMGAGYGTQMLRLTRRTLNS